MKLFLISLARVAGARDAALPRIKAAIEIVEQGVEIRLGQSVQLRGHLSPAGEAFHRASIRCSTVLIIGSASIRSDGFATAPSSSVWKWPSIRSIVRSLEQMRVVFHRQAQTFGESPWRRASSRTWRSRSPAPAESTPAPATARAAGWRFPKREHHLEERRTAGLALGV